MNKLIVAVMQPTFLPWIGYFDLIDQSDRFVFLDSVQFSKQSWQQRNRLKGLNGEQWLTVPVLTKGLSNQSISEVKINQNAKFKEKMIKTITQIYRKAPFFDSYIDELSDILLKSYVFLAALNIELIMWVCKQLGIDTKMIRSSSLKAKGKKVELLINICKELNADTYLSTPGSKVYIEENNLFTSNDIDLVYHAFEHPEYHQINGKFVPYMSIIDLLFNEGPASLSIIRKGQR
jgi:hypothetical protein